MNKNELWKLYCEKEKAFEKAKGKRMRYTISAFAIVYFLLFYTLDKPHGLKEVAVALAAAIVLSFIHIAINATIFGQLSNVSRAEEETLKAIKKRIDEAE